MSQSDKIITLPHNFTPRAYQLNVWNAFLRDGVKRGLCVWPRKTGKDCTDLNIMIIKAFQRVSNYFYYFPTGVQARKSVWEQVDPITGFRLLDHIPQSLRKSVDKGDMKVELVNGSTIQFTGTDDPNSIVGPNPAGAVLSEFSLQNPMALNYLRPIFAVNQGWLMVNYTPRGHNHAYSLHQLVKNDPEWFCELLTRDDTGIPTLEAIEADRRTGMREEMIQQEYYSSYEAALVGAYYGEEIRIARAQGRIGYYPYDPNLPVHTAWDLGVRHSTGIWFWQEKDSHYYFIDYFEDSGTDKGVEYYANVLKTKNYRYGDYWAPHDIKVTEWGTGKSRLELALAVGLRFKTADKIGRDDGIEAARYLLQFCHFDETRTARGLDCLSAYHSEFVEKKDAFRKEPVDDWSCDGADAFRTFAVRKSRNVSMSTMDSNKLSRCIIPKGQMVL